jgi:hypothetical protein
MGMTRRTGLALIALGALACTKQKAKEEREMTKVPDVAELGREVGLSLPPSTKIVAVRRESGMDDAVFAKLELARADWQRLAAQPPLSTAEFGLENKSYLSSDDGWWNPSTIEGLRVAQIEMPKGRWLNVGVDEATKPGVVTLYVLNHST